MCSREGIIWRRERREEECRRVRETKMDDEAKHYPELGMAHGVQPSHSA
jgi:hypothetical protein